MRVLSSLSVWSALRTLLTVDPTGLIAEIIVQCGEFLRGENDLRFDAFDLLEIVIDGENRFDAFLESTCA